MSDFVDFMTEFAGQVVRYTGVSAISGLSARIDTIIGWFTQDPIEKLANDVENISKQTSNLNDKLGVAVPELQTAADLLQEYKDLLTQIENLCDSNVELSTGMFVNMKKVGQSLVTGFVNGIQSKSRDFKNVAKELVKGFKTQLNDSVKTCQTTMVAWASNVKQWFIERQYGAINHNTFLNYAKTIVNGFGNGVTCSHNSSKLNMTSWATNVKSWFSEIASYSAFYNIGKDVVTGFNAGVNNFYSTTASYMRKWANAAKNAYKAALDSNSPSKVFMRIGRDTVLGYNLGISNLGRTTKDVVNTWANSFTSVSPVMRFAVDTSALKYYTSDSFSKSVSTDVVNSRSLSVTGFKEGMEEFYHEYIEPTMAQMAEDMRRQADKNEQTIVQIGNRTVSDAVTTQRKANGYAFVK